MIYTVLFIPARASLVRLSAAQAAALEALRAVDKVGESARVFALLDKKTERTSVGSRAWLVHARATKNLVEMGLALIDGRRARLTDEGRSARKPTRRDMKVVEAAECRARDVEVLEEDRFHGGGR